MFHYAVSTRGRMRVRALLLAGPLLASLLLAACGGGGGSSSGGSMSGSGGGGYGGSSGGTSSGGTSSGGSGATAYSMTALVSDGSISAATKDAKLMNPWGLAFATKAPAWVMNNRSQTATVYDGLGRKQPLTVAVPSGLNGAADPTGEVAYSGSGFVVSAGGKTASAQFLIAGEGGTISGWALSVDPNNAVLAYDDGAGGAMYTGLTLASDSGGTVHLYAADFKNNKIDVFDTGFHKVTLTGSFKDTTLPAGYAPFNIQALGASGQTLIYVTYAKTQGNGQSAPGAGLGLVDVYDAEGNFQSHLIATGGKLNAPWGLALAPSAFGTFSSDLLVGNFGDGTINAFSPSTGAFVGTIADSNNTPIANPGLWAIAFGNGAESQPTTTLFFTAGVGGGADGLYGRIDLGSTPPDLTPPTVSLTAPADGSTVSGSVTVTATASDAKGISSVKLFAGATVIATLTSSPYSTTWDTTKLANGSVVLTAEAVDTAGNSTTSSPVTVSVSNSGSPSVTLTQLQQQIFTPICSVCHTGVGNSLPGSMNLNAGHTYASLVNVASSEQPSVKRVAPGDPNNSYVVRKLEGAAGITGGRMPLGGPYLDQATMNMVTAWIQEGAQNN